VFETTVLQIQTNFRVFSKSMQIRYLFFTRHLKSIINSAETTNRVCAITWSPNNQKLAVVTADRVVQLFDETGERKDKFSTKPSDPKVYIDN
jgi:WD40 repeat protein